ncbi:hypothetical protein D3C85_1780820 [compost metagenome]
MFLLEQHPAIVLKRVPYVFFVIFAAQRKQHAFLLLLNYKLLKHPVRLIHTDAKRSFLAANAMP